MNDLSPKQRVFGMLASLARIVNDSADLNAERQRLATLIEHSRSWETEVVDVPTPPDEHRPMAGAEPIFAKAREVLLPLDGLSYAEAAQVMEVAQSSMAGAIERLCAEQTFSPPALKDMDGQGITYV